MKPISMRRVFLWLLAVVAFCSGLQGQPAGPGISVAPAQPVSPSVISFSDTLAGQPDGSITVTFALYPDQQSLNATWTETQVVQVTQNKYTVLLGSTTPDGIPAGVFAADQAHWLGVQINGTEKRFLLVSVPYAMKAMEAERLGGLLPSEYATVAQLQSALQNPAASGSSTPGSATKTAGTAPLAAASGTPPQPATDFTDNNTSEVLLVTQQGAGFAIHAISAGNAALFAENSTATGIALKALASTTTGANIGLLAQSASPNGIAGVLDNTGNGQILSLRSNGGEVASVDNFGNFKASQIQALNFVGPGFGLTNIPNSATTATPSNSNNTIVARDQFGGFSAGQIQALNFVGPGFGLTNIPNSATTAASSNTNDTIVTRDQFGGFSAGQIQALNFVGPGFGLTNIPNSATTATPLNSNNTIVARDQFGSFSGSQIQALNFVGPGFGLTNIPNSATTATEFNFPSTIVARDTAGGFLTSTIQVQQSLISKGITDFTNATSTAPVKTVLSVNTPSSCQASQELLIKTDAPAGQQLFICNATGNGYVLVGDGNAAGVTSVRAGDGSVAIGGTAAAPTVEVANGGITSAKLAPNAVTSGNIANGSITNAQLAANAVTTVNLAPNAVTSANIADGSLPAAKINGTAATLMAGNIFYATQTMPVLNVSDVEATTVSMTSDLKSGGALYTDYPSSGAILNGPVKLLSNGTATATDTTDTNGVIGIAIQSADSSGNGNVSIAYSGRAKCVFDQTTGLPVTGNFAGISHLQRGECRDLGPTVLPGSGQVLGRILGSQLGSPLAEVLLVQTQDDSDTLVSINTGPGLTGGPISSTGTISIANAGVTNTMLQNSALAVNAGAGLSGGGTVTLGSSVMLTNTGALSFNGRTGNVVPAAGDYSFTQVGGTAAATQLPATIVYNNQSNTFAADQTINGALNANSLSTNVLTTTALSTNLISGASALISGSSNGSTSVFSVTDNGLATAPAAFSVNSQNNPAANFSTGSGIAGVFTTNFAPGTILSGRTGSGEVFNVDTTGNLLTSGALSTLSPAGATRLYGPVELRSNGTVGATRPVNSVLGGAIGIAISNPDINQNVQVAYAGRALCQFESISFPFPGHYVGVSRGEQGTCSDLGANTPPSGTVVIGRVLFPPPGVTLPPQTAQVLLFPQQPPGSVVTSISTGPGLVGGPITSSGTISIANAGVTNAMLQNSALAVNPGAGLSGGGTVSLGGSVTLNNTGVLSFNGRTGNILPAPGDYSFSQLGGTASAGQLPVGVVFNNASNTFTSNQTINGSLTVIDSSPSGGSGFSAVSQNNPAAVFTSIGPTILVAGNAVRGVFNLDSAGNLNIAGAVTGASFSGDGSALANVNASSVGGVAGANLATTSALNTETAARQSADTTLQNNISSEAASRQSADLALQANMSAETTARQSDTSNLQASINNVSAADAKLASSNTFTAGTQDFSAAGATLPVRALPSAQTPASCVASKELLIKTDASAGKQLFICDASGTTWNLVGDGASGGVTSFNGRNGSVNPSSNDYSFAQISGSVAPGQLPANIVYNNQANTFSTDQTVNGTVKAVSFSGSGAFLTFVNAAMFNGLGPDNFAQMNTANSFSKKLTLVGGSSTQAALNIGPGPTPTSPVIGDVWNTGTTIQYVDNSSNTLSLVATPQGGGMQMLKLTASLTPTNVNAQTCSEQTFTVSGVNSGDVLLSVQLTTHSPGTNIAIGGWRVSATNAVAIQFCNVSRNSSTPAAGAYTLALMR